MTDAAYDAYRMSEEHSSYILFLDLVVVYLKDPTEQNLAKVLKGRQWFGRYSGAGWPKEGEGLKLQLARLLEGDKKEWSDLLVPCICKGVEQSIVEGLKGVSPFSGKKILVIEKRPNERKIIFHCKYEDLFVEGNKIRSNCDDIQILLV